MFPNFTIVFIQKLNENYLYRRSELKLITLVTFEYYTEHVNMCLFMIYSYDAWNKNHFVADKSRYNSTAAVFNGCRDFV